MILAPMDCAAGWGPPGLVARAEAGGPASAGLPLRVWTRGGRSRTFRSAQETQPPYLMSVRDRLLQRTPQTPFGGAGCAAPATTLTGGWGLASPAVRDHGGPRTAGPHNGSAGRHYAFAPRSGQSRRNGGCFNSPAGPSVRQPREHGGTGRANQLRVPSTCAGTRPTTAARPSSGEETAGPRHRTTRRTHKPVPAQAHLDFSDQGDST